MNLSFAFDSLFVQSQSYTFAALTAVCLFFVRWCVSLERTRDTTAALPLLNFFIMGIHAGHIHPNATPSLNNPLIRLSIPWGKPVEKTLWNSHDLMDLLCVRCGSVN